MRTHLANYASVWKHTIPPTLCDCSKCTATPPLTAYQPGTVLKPKRSQQCEPVIKPISQTQIEKLIGNRKIKLQSVFALRKR